MPQETPLEQAELRTVLGHFASGVTVVTGISDGEPVGFSLQAFLSLSLEPPMVAIAASRRSTTWPSIHGSGAFCANVLGAGQEALCRDFARQGRDRFAGVGWSPAPTGSPCLDGVLAWVDCRIAQVHEAGDHWLVTGAVVAAGSGPGEPLVFYRSGFGSFRP